MLSLRFPLLDVSNCSLFDVRFHVWKSKRTWLSFSIQSSLSCLVSAANQHLHNNNIHQFVYCEPMSTVRTVSETGPSGNLQGWKKRVESTKNCKSLFGHWRLAPKVSKSPCEPMLNAQLNSRNKRVNNLVHIFNLLKPIFLLKTPVLEVNNYITNSFNIYQGIRFCVFRGVAALSESWPWAVCSASPQPIPVET